LAGFFVLALFVLVAIASSVEEPLSVATATAQATHTPTATAQATHTPTATAQATHTPTATARATHTPTATAQATHTPTATARATHTPTATARATHTPTATARATHTPTATAQATHTPLPASMEDSIFSSGGLGLSKEAWDNQHTQTGDFNGWMGTIYDDKYTVIFFDNRVWYILRQWSSANAVSPQDAEAESVTLLPKDSQLVTVYSPTGLPELTVHLYMSDALKERFTEDNFIGGEPGNFIVVYATFDNRVTGIVIGLGNNP